MRPQNSKWFNCAAVCPGKQRRGSKKKACVPVFILCGGGFILSQPSARSAPVLSVEIGKEDNVRQKHFTA